MSFRRDFASPNRSGGHLPTRSGQKILGNVNSTNTPTVKLRIKGTDGAPFEVETVIDTGFNASLTIPKGLASMLNLKPEAVGFATLADGTTHDYDVCAVTVEWDGIDRFVSAYVIGAEPMLGMRMLARCRLSIEIIPDGRVEILQIF